MTFEHGLPKILGKVKQREWKNDDIPQSAEEEEHAHRIAGSLTLGFAGDRSRGKSVSRRKPSSAKRSRSCFAPSLPALPFRLFAATEKMNKCTYTATYQGSSNELDNRLASRRKTGESSKGFFDMIERLCFSTKRFRARARKAERAGRF